MLTAALTLVGLFIGIALDETATGIACPLLGFVIGQALAQRKVRRRLEARLVGVENTLAELRKLVAGQEADEPKVTRQGEAPLTAALQTANPLAAAPQAASPQAANPQPAEPLAATPSTAAPQAPTPASAEPLAATSPTAASHAWRANPLAFLTGGNTVVRVGIVVLLFGVGFVVKYAAEFGYLPVELRLLATAFLGLALIGLGFRLRQRRQAYAMSLQGGGIGVLYVVVTAAMRLYALVPPGLAFALFVGLAAFGSLLAVLEDALALAVLASLGGFLAPILASTGQGSHVALFSYYAVLNAGILGIAYYKAWRPLNLLGFFFTFGVGFAWGIDKYEPAFFASTEPFLLLFILMFVAVALLFGWRKPAPGGAYVDGTLVFALPIVSFGLQVGLVRSFELGVAYSALGYGAFYLGLAVLLFRRAPAQMRLIVEAFLALGVGFATLTLPLALDARWTAAGWALEGAGLVWIGVRQRRWLARAAGELLVLAAGVALLVGPLDPTSGPPVVNGLHLGATLIALAAYFVAHQLSRHPVRETIIAPVFLGWGALYFVGSGLAEIAARLSHDAYLAASLAFIAATAVLHALLGARLRLVPMRLMSLGLWPAAAGFAIASLSWDEHPAQHYGWLAWPFTVGALVYLVQRRMVGEGANAVLRSIALWIVTSLVAAEAAYGLGVFAGGAEAWRLAAWLATANLALISARRFLPRTAIDHALGAGAIAAVVALTHALLSLEASGDPSPLPYLPLVNPLDLAQAGGLIALLFWTRAAPATPLWRDFLRFAHWVIAGLGFLWLSAVVARTVVSFDGLPYERVFIWSSVTLQSSLSIVWTALALVVMLLAHRARTRAPWMAGASLLGVVVLKLFTVDLSSVGTLARITSFVGVGILLLVIGYLAPVPPRKVAAA